MSDQISKKEKTIENFVLKLKQNIKSLFFAGLILIASLILIMVLNQKRQNNLIAISDQYYQAKILINNNRTSEGKNILESIILKKNKVYSPLSLYLIIDTNIEQDNKKITMFFDELIKIKKLSDENKNLIKIKKALYLSSFVKDEQLLIDLLNPIINSNSLWRTTAIEFMVKYFLHRNQKIKSNEYLKLLNNK
jgi:hypothetical protein